MRYSSRFFLYAPFLSFVALALAVMIYWGFAAAALNKQLDAANGHDIMPGVKFSFTGKRIAGFPFRLDTVLDGMRVEIAASKGPIIWQAEHFASHMLTYGPHQTIYEAADRQEISWHDSSGKLHDFVFIPGTMRASAITAKGQLARFDLDVVEIASPDLGGGRFQIHIRRNPAMDALDIALSGDTIRLAPDLQAGFGDKISHFELVAKAAPEAPLAPLLAGKSDWRSAVENWRVHGGSISIDQLSVPWGHIGANGHGALKLDDTHRLSGKIAANVSYSGTLHLSKEDDAKLADALSATAMFGQTKGNPTLPLSINFTNGSVSVANIPAGAIGPLY